MNEPEHPHLPRRKPSRIGDSCDCGCQAEVERLQDTADDLHGRLILSEQEVKRLRAENTQLLLTKAGAFKAQMEHAAEVERLRAEIEDWRQEAQFHADESARLWGLIKHWGYEDEATWKPPALAKEEA